MVRNFILVFNPYSKRMKIRSESPTSTNTETLQGLISTDPLILYGGLYRESHTSNITDGQEHLRGFRERAEMDDSGTFFEISGPM
jgi:hypothetical protein